MKNHLVSLALAAAMESMQHLPQTLKTTGHKIASNAGFNGFSPRQAKNKSYQPKSTSKYKSHQGKQECARRLKVYSPAWHSAQTMVN